MKYTVEPIKYVAKPIQLYCRAWFEENSTEYICLYKCDNFTSHAFTLHTLDKPDKNAYIILEKTINPEINPHWYVCIKCGDECREDLRGE